MSVSPKTQKKRPHKGHTAGKGELRPDWRAPAQFGPPNYSSAGETLSSKKSQTSLKFLGTRRNSFKASCNYEKIMRDRVVFVSMAYKRIQEAGSRERTHGDAELIHSLAHQL